jgi:hypothetical protein
MLFMRIGDKVINLSSVNYVEFDSDVSVTVRFIGTTATFSGQEARDLRAYFGRALTPKQAIAIDRQVRETSERNVEHVDDGD